MIDYGLCTHPNSHSQFPYANRRLEEHHNLRPAEGMGATGGAFGGVGVR